MSEMEVMPEVADQEQEGEETAAPDVEEAAAEPAPEEAEEAEAEEAPEAAAGEEEKPADLSGTGIEEEEEELTVDLDNLSKMKVSELKDILKALDLPISGTKPTLIERIQEHFAEEDKQAGEEEGAGGETAETPAEGKAEKPAVDVAEEKELLDATTPATDTTPASTDTTVAPTAPDDGLTDEERKEQRKEKFGLLTDDDKKEKRAAKFGVDTEKSVEEKKKARAVKFGLDENDKPGVEVNVTDDKKAARAARFGTPITTKTSAPTTTKPANGTAKTPVTPPADTDKLKKRAARFSLDSTTTDDEKPAKTPKLVDISTTLKDKVESGNTKVSLSSAGLSAAEKKKLRALKFGA